MFKEKPFIYPFQTPGGYYIYDVNTNSILKTRKSVYYLLLNKTQPDENDSVEGKAVISKMVEDGFLSSNRIKEIFHSESDILPYILSNRLHTITLQVTHQCNLRCSYCVYSGGYLNRRHSDKAMSLETAIKGIDFLINNSSDSRRLNIGFYGGEPLLRFDFIKKCIEYAEEKAEGKTLSFNITSNGTIVDDKKIEYFEAHDVNLMISLDGAKEVHDRNRRFANGGGSFDKIMENLETVKRKFPEYYKKITFNAVIDPQNDFSCANEFFAGYDIVKDSFINSSIINYEYSEKEIDVSDDFNIKWDYEVFKLFLSKVDRLDEKYVSKLMLPYFDRLKTSMYNKRKTTRSLPDKVHHGGPCVPGAQRLFMNVRGDFFPCERVSEVSEVMKIGNVDEGFYIDKVQRLLNIGKLTEDKCKNCWSFRFCTLCAASADNLTDLSPEHKLKRCSDVKNLTGDIIKNYCALAELGYKFGDNEKPVFIYKDIEGGEYNDSRERESDCISF